MAHLSNEYTAKKNNKIMDNEIQTLYQQKYNLEATDRKFLNKPIKTRLQMDIKTKAAWIKSTKKEIIRGLKTNCKRIKKKQIYNKLLHNGKRKNNNKGTISYTGERTVQCHQH
jgi:hypothetical protein